jgi:PAS domain S-box-containing protein
MFRLFPQAERGFVLLRDEQRGELSTRAIKMRRLGPSNPILSRTVLRPVMDEGKAVLIEDLQVDRRFDASHSVDEAGVRTLMCVPLRDHTRKPVGAIQIDTSDPHARFTDEDLDLLAAVAGQVSLTVDNARLYKEAREALRRQAEAQAVIDAMLAAAPVAVAFLDVKLNYVRVNRAMALLNGMAVESHPGRGLLDVPGPVAPLVEPLVRKVAEAGERSSGVEIRGEALGRSRTWLSYCYPATGPDGRAVGIGLILEDVTEARRAEEELRASEERYRLLFESNPHPMWVYDLETLRFLAVNEAATRRYGYSREEFLEMTIADIRPREDVPSMRARVAEVRDATYLNASGWRHVTKDGVILDVEISSHALVFSGRDARLVLALDVTRRLEVEVAMHAAKDAAESANRAKDRFLAVLSHELRTPLTPVLLAVSALLEDETIPASLRPILEMIGRNIRMEAGLVDDLLDVARIGRGGLSLEPEMIDIHRAISEAIEVCRPQVEAAGLVVSTDLTATRSLVRADPARLRQVFWNLIHNAAKFAPGGALVISSRDDPSPAGPGRLFVEFRDTGVGLSPGELDRIFEPFERGDSSRAGRHTGLGLGLAISRSIAEASGGRLAASSEGAGKGTTFRLEMIGFAPSEPISERDDDHLVSPAPGRPARVLLVEDNADTRRFLALALSRRHHEIVTAEGVDAARAAARGRVFDLIISDIELPDGTGLELIRELKGHSVGAGIALSGFGSEEDIRMSLSAGFSEHLTKPVDINRLDEAVARVLAGVEP